MPLIVMRAMADPFDDSAENEAQHLALDTRRRSATGRIRRPGRRLLPASWCAARRARRRTHPVAEETITVTTPLPAGPLETVSIGGRSTPLYVLPFDKAGVLAAPATAEHLRAAVAGGLTDVIVISHGWNADWTDALGFYRRFIGVLDRLATTHGGPRPGMRAAVVGVSWPSIALSSDTAPAMAGGTDPRIDLAEIADLAEELVDPADRAEFYALTQADRLDRRQALRLAELLAALYGRADEELPTGGTGGAAAADAEQTVAAWEAAAERLAEDTGPVVVSGPTGPRVSAAGPVATPAATPAAGPAAAGLLDVLDPRNIVRLSTVLLMKDRAGVVGHRGVGPLVGRLLDANPGVRVHHVGHSYGCKVVLSAMCSPAVPRSVRSALLLQPALSYLAFAADVPDRHEPGGYRAATTRCELPIMVTWSRHDFPLRTAFSLAVRRRSDLGEQDIGAAGLETPPSRFAAMGGWGPQAGPDVADVRIQTPDRGPYAVPAGRRVVALEGDQAIGGHSDVVNDATAWALYDLMSRA
jgi:hypothetical protein